MYSDGKKVVLNSLILPNIFESKMNYYYFEVDNDYQ